MSKWTSYICDNIAQENYLCNVDLERTVMFLQENDVFNEKVVLSKKQLPAQCWPTFHSLVNVVQIHLRQHCTRKLLAQCWPRPHTHLFAGKQPAKQPYTVISARKLPVQ